MYARKFFFYSLAIIGAMLLATVALHESDKASAKSQPATTQSNVSSSLVDNANANVYGNMDGNVYENDGGMSVATIKATPQTIAPIDVLTLSTTVTSTPAPTDRVTVQMVVRDAAGHTVLQEKQANVGINRDGKQSVYWTWRIPDRLADGPYTVEMTVLGAGETVLATGTRDRAFVVQRNRH